MDIEKIALQLTVAEFLVQVLLTSFEMLMRDQTKLAKETWQYIVVDEAHR
jgi:SNF2 family DNA or RNA helicase